MTSSSVRLRGALDELAVDLQERGRQVLEVGERAEAGAEVVDREAAAEVGQRLGEAARVLHVGDRRRLGDLEDQARRVDAAAASSSPAISAISSSSSSERPDRLTSSSRSGVLGQQPDRLPRTDPAVDRVDQPDALGGRQERARQARPRRRRASAAAPRSGAVGARRARSRIGWHVELEAAAVRSASVDALLPVAARAARGLLGCSGPKRTRAVAAGVLGRVHRGGRRGRAASCRRAGVVEHARRRRLAVTLHRLARRSGLVAAHRRDELARGGARLSASASGRRPRARRRRGARARRSSAAARAAAPATERSSSSPARVAERVVDVLEVVEVEHEQRAAGVVAARRSRPRARARSSKRRRLSRPVSASWSAR